MVKTTGQGSGKQDSGSDAQPPEQVASVVPERSGNVDHSFTLQAVMELKASQGATNQALANLADNVKQLSTKLDKIDDLRVDIGKIETNITHLSTEITSLKSKLDKVRNWIVGAGAIIAFIAFEVGVAVKFIPVPSVVAPVPPVTPASPAPITPPPIQENPVQLKEYINR